MLVKFMIIKYSGEGRAKNDTGNKVSIIGMNHCMVARLKQQPTICTSPS